jgi:hypothetical protein
MSTLSHHLKVLREAGTLRVVANVSFAVTDCVPSRSMSGLPDCCPPSSPTSAPGKPRGFGMTDSALPRQPPHGETLGLSADGVLTTTRAVRKRLDLRRPVPREVIEDCVRIALQAPSGRNRQRWDFVFVEDQRTRAAVADLWRLGLRAPAPASGAAGPAFSGTAWTTSHLSYEREMAQLLGIPYDTVVQVALTPVAYTLGTDFKRGPRAEAEAFTHWDHW